MAADTPSAVHSFDLKSAELPVLAVTLRSTEVEQVIADLARRLADDPDFFDNDPVLIDLQHVQHHPEPIDFARLIAALRMGANVSTSSSIPAVCINSRSLSS